MSEEFIKRVWPHRWKINVVAGGYYTSLTHQFSGDDINLVYEDDETGLQCFAYSSHIDGLGDDKIVAERVYGLEVILNGALRVFWGNAEFMPIRFTEFVRLDSGLWTKIHPERLDEYPFDDGVPLDQPILDLMNPKRNFASHLIFLSKSDENLRQLLLLVGLIASHSPAEKILTWGTLYKICDLVRFMSGERGLDFDSFTDKSKIDRFTAACNNMSILGISSRHGVPRTTPPKRVLTDLPEAIGLIVSMASKFSEAYVASKYP